MRAFLLLTVAALTLMAEDPAWKTKPTPAWTEADAREILAESPWSKTIRAAILPLQTEDERREGGNMGQQHGVGFDGIADDRPRIQPPKSVIDIVKPEAPTPVIRPSIQLQLRWESALPIRVAELKSHASGVPNLAEEGYVLAVYGIPDAHFKGGDPKSLGSPFKSQAFLKRAGKTNVRPSSVEVYQGQDGLVVVYLFPLSAEITKNDRRLEFDAQIGRVAIAQAFDLEEMQFNGQLEL